MTRIELVLREHDVVAFSTQKHYYYDGMKGGRPTEIIQEFDPEWMVNIISFWSTDADDDKNLSFLSRESAGRKY